MNRILLLTMPQLSPQRKTPNRKMRGHLGPAEGVQADHLANPLQSIAAGGHEVAFVLGIRQQPPNLVKPVSFGNGSTQVPSVNPINDQPGFEAGAVSAVGGDEFRRRLPGRETSTLAERRGAAERREAALQDTKLVAGPIGLGPERVNFAAIEEFQGDGDVCDCRPYGLGDGRQGPAKARVRRR